MNRTLLVQFVMLPKILRCFWHFTNRTHLAVNEGILSLQTTLPQVSYTDVNGHPGNRSLKASLYKLDDYQTTETNCHACLQRG